MFGLSFSGQLIQGSAERTWNCISQLANLVWYKVNNYRQPIMPRQRRKHNSRSRSRSHSHDRDRDAKRRKIEQFESPNHKRSVSPSDDPPQDQHPREQPDSTTSHAAEFADSSNVISLSDSEDDHSINTANSEVQQEETTNNTEPRNDNATQNDHINGDEASASSDVDMESTLNSVAASATEGEGVKSETVPGEITNTPGTTRDRKSNIVSDGTPNSVKKLFQEKTPTRRLTPKQLEKKMESEKKRKLREKDKEERERQKQLEKEQKEAEKQKKKEQKQKEIEEKQKEIERKHKEKEEKEEQKRQEKELKLKQKEEERLRKQQEIDEKNKEKLKEVEKKQKAAAAFVSFFVPKKMNDSEEKKTEEASSVFLPFEVKCDMRLPPPRREPLTCDEKNNLEKFIENNRNGFSYLKDIKVSKARGCQKTCFNRDADDDVILVEEDEVLLGEKICESKPRGEKMKVKLLQFHENQRPAYYGTWRKKSKNISGRRPLGREDIFDYEVDSDDDWEEEEQGENLEVMSDEEKENEPENEDYEVDNEFFVPHGHLSDDEVDDEEISKLSPESQKQKLKLLKDAFDMDIKSKTQKIKPRSIGCIWYNKDGDNVDDAIDSYLHPLKVITNKIIEIKKRVLETNTPKKKRKLKSLPDNLMGILVKIVQGNMNKREKLTEEFLNYIQSNNIDMELSKSAISRQISSIATWSSNDGLKSHCWIVNDDVAGKYNIDLALPENRENVECNSTATS